MDKIPEERDTRLAFLERWAESQQSRAREERYRLSTEAEAERLHAGAVARAAARAGQRTGQVVKVYVPFTEFAPGVREALKATGHPVTEVYVGARDDAYWELLNGLWSEGESFIVVEHDIVVRADTLEELENCPCEWCSFGAPYLGHVYHGLGCVKFSDTLISRHPKAMEQVAAFPPDEKHPSKHYCTLDAYLQRTLLGEYMHCHEEVLGHVRPYNGAPWPSHGCAHRLT